MSGPPPATLRPLRPGDHDELAELWCASWRSTGLAVARGANAASLRPRIDSELGAGWAVTVAAADGGLAGFLALKPAAALLDQLFVAPDWQGRGVGKLLLARAQAAMPGGFTLHVAAEDTRARGFYAAAGLVEAGTGVHPELGHDLVHFRWG